MDKSVEHLDITTLLSKSKAELIQLVLEKEDYAIPLSVLTSGLHPLQSVVKYLRDVQHLSMKNIALLLNRNVQTIWTSYNQVKHNKLVLKKSDITIPISLLSKNKNSILESTVMYLLSVHHLSLSQIARLLNKSVKTVWTCKHRFIIKGGTI